MSAPHKVLDQWEAVTGPIELHVEIEKVFLKWMGGEVFAVLDMNDIFILGDWVTRSVVCQLSVHFFKVGCGPVDESFTYLMEG